MPAATLSPAAVLPDGDASRAPDGAVASPRGSRRLVWVDVAKGASILLVVVHHVVLYLAAAGWLPDDALAASRLLGTLRMPLFFLASGLLAARGLTRSWGDVLGRRVALLAWLYVVWCVVRYVVLGAVLHGADLGAWRAPGTAVAELWLPASGLWFLYALALFTALGRATARVPAVLRLGAAAVLSAVVGSGMVAVDSYAWRSMATYLVFFVLGAVAGPALRRVTLPRPATGALAVGLGAGFAVLAPLVRGEAGEVPGARLAVSLVAVAAGVAGAMALAGTLVGRPLAWLGGRTLEVYLVHAVVVVAVVRVLGTRDADAGAAGVAVAVVLAAGSVAASLGVARWARRAGAAWLLALPRRTPTGPAAAR